MVWLSVAMWFLSGVCTVCYIWRHDPEDKVMGYAAEDGRISLFLPLLFFIVPPVGWIVYLVEYGSPVKMPTIPTYDSWQEARQEREKRALASNEVTPCEEV